MSSDEFGNQGMQADQLDVQGAKVSVSGKSADELFGLTPWDGEPTSSARIPMNGGEEGVYVRAKRCPSCLFDGVNSQMKIVAVDAGVEPSIVKMCMVDECDHREEVNLPDGSVIPNV